jgi:succinate dehydrogenase/fumarate reductase flavoprotein subunit
VSKTLRAVVTRAKGIRKAGDLLVVDLVRAGDDVVGAVAWHIPTGAPVTIAAKATVVAAGGLTRLYRRNSASANMGGDGYALALRAGAPLVDMTRALGERPAGDNAAFDLRRLEWFDLRNMLLVARTVAMSALRRRESRGAHQREDFPGMLPDWRVNQVARLGAEGITLAAVPAVTPAAAQ